MNNLHKSFSFWLLVIFASIGAIMVGTFVHEYSHYNDYKQFDKTEEEFCILNYNPDLSLDSSLGYYSFYYNASDLNEIERVGKYSEFKAYSLTILIYAIFIISFNKLLFNNVRKI